MNAEEQITNCDGCGATVPRKRRGRGQPGRWCERCVLIANDLNVVRHLVERYAVPPATRLDAVLPAIQQQLRSGKGAAVDRIADLLRAQAERELNERRRGWTELIEAIVPSVEFHRYNEVEEELFGDLASRRQRVYHLVAFARTTFKDDGAQSPELLEAARTYLKARLLEEGFVAGADSARDRFAWPTMGETRPGARERT